MILLSSAVAVVALLQGTKRARPGLDSHGWNQLWPFIFPLSLIILSGLVRYLSNRHFRIWGSVGANLRYVCTAVALVGLTWLSVVLVTRGAEQLIRLAGVERPLTRQLIRLSSRVAALVVILLWTFFGGQRLGIPITALLTGLGVGGLAVALAAQGTIENLIGGISLYADQPVRIGEVFKLGDRTGTLEEVGLRSAKVRTREETVVTVPNAEFAKLPLENLSRRTGYFLRSTLGIGYEATGDQVRYVLSRLTALLTAHPQIREDTEMVRLVDISPSHLEIEIRARADTTDFQHFTAIRQEMLLKAIAIVEEAGLALAVPPRLLHSAEDPRVESEKSGEGLRRVMKWRQKHDPAP